MATSNYVSTQSNVARKRSLDALTHVPSQYSAANFVQFPSRYWLLGTHSGRSQCHFLKQYWRTQLLLTAGSYKLFLVLSMILTFRYIRAYALRLKSYGAPS